MRPLQNPPKSPKCLGGNLGDFAKVSTGQNPASSKGVGVALAKALG